MKTTTAPSGWHGTAARLALLAALWLALPTQSQVLISRTFIVNESIPDLGGGVLAKSQTLAVGAANVDKVQVSLDIIGRGGPMFNGDLYATLGHETKLAVLLNRVGVVNNGDFGYADNGFHVTLDDSATDGDIHRYQDVRVPAGNGAISGVWRPDGRNVDPQDVVAADNRGALLDQFHNTAASGEWRLLLSDESGSGTAKLVSWGLSIRTTAAPTGTITFNGDTVSADSAQTFNNNVTLDGNTKTTGTSPLTFSGNTTLTGNRSLEADVTTTFSGTIGESGGANGLTIQGSGRVIFTGNNTYSGSTTVDGGHLVVNNTTGSGTGSGSVMIKNGGTLSGSGNIGGNVLVNNGGIISPGNSPGELSAGSMTWGASGHYEWEINEAGGAKGGDPGWDFQNISGILAITATAGNKFSLDLITLGLDNNAGQIHDFDETQFYSWTIATAGGGVTGFDATKIQLDTSGFANDHTHGIFGLILSGNNVNLTYTPVPEPAATAAVVGLGLLGIALFRRHARQRQGV